MRSIQLVSILLFAASAALGQSNWVQQPSPSPSPYRNLLRGISGIDSTDIWAVGDYQVTANPIIHENLVLHWDGTDWSLHQVENFSSNLNILWDVIALSTDNVWAVGDYSGAGSSAQGQIQHWDGSEWSAEPINFSGSSFLWAVDASAPDDVWAVGGKAGIGPDTGFVYHYDGSDWSERNVPPVGTEKNWLYDVSALAPDDVWAVGTYGIQPFGGFHHMALHWDGDSWTNVPLPSLFTSNGGILSSVHMIASDDVWAAGEFTLGGGVIIHWDGNAWSVVEQTVIGVAFAPLAPDDIYAFGSDIIHWNGSNWSVVDDLEDHPAPSMLSSTVLNDGGIWAAGRDIDANSFFSTLVYRMSGDISTSIGSHTTTSSELTVHPNPFSDRINIHVPQIRTQSAELTIHEIATGREVLQRHVVMNSNEIVSLDLSDQDLASGTYVLTIQTVDRVRQVKLVRE